MKVIFLLILFPIFSYSQDEYQIATFANAADEVYADIWMADNSYQIPYLENRWIRTERIVCLSGIMPMKNSHQYSGLSFKPTFEEIVKWKNWFEQNKQNIRYSTEPGRFAGNKLIVIEYEKGKVRQSNCFYNLH